MLLLFEWFTILTEKMIDVIVVGKRTWLKIEVALFKSNSLDVSVAREDE